MNLPLKQLKNKVPTSKQISSWENAIKQSDKALLVTRNERKLKFMFNYDEPCSAQKDANQKPLKVVCQTHIYNNLLSLIYSVCIWKISTDILSVTL